MNILVTGGLGLIGHNIVQKLTKLGHKVIVYDNCTNYGIIPQAELDYLISERKKLIGDVEIHEMDILQGSMFDWLLPHHNIEAIIHLASFPRQKVVNANPVWGSSVMSGGLLILLEAAAKHNVKRFTYASSSMVYGDFKDYVTEDAVCRPQGQYGILKLAGEWLVKDYTRKHGIEHTILRPSAVYGPLDVEDRVISKFLLTAMRGETLKVNGGNETLDFTYVDDAADGFVNATLSPLAANRTYNITKSHSKTLLAAAELAVKLVGKGSIEVRDKDADFPSRGALDITAARRDFGFNPKVDIDEGFEIYHNWLKNSEYWSQNVMAAYPQIL
jgi:nucleoside-diphosphate-sugar epimerase